MSEEVKEESKLDDKKTKDIAIAQFFQSTDLASKSDISLKGFKRAFMYAFHLGISDKTNKIRLRNDEEKKLASIIGIALDSRVLLHAYKMKEQIKKNEEQQNEENTEGEGQDV